MLGRIHRTDGRKQNRDTANIYATLKLSKRGSNIAYLYDQRHTQITKLISITENMEMYKLRLYIYITKSLPDFGIFSFSQMA